MKVKIITNRRTYNGKCKDSLSVESLKELIRRFIKKTFLPRERIKTVIVE